jgi:predicted house-cleaning noncanonical NTP pyrophosphatase (MazG superfamily)
MADRGIAKSSKVRYAKGKEYQTYLFAKLMEECAEVIGANTKEQTTEELADLLEVVDAIREEFKISVMDVKEVKTQKKCEKGGFYEGCILEGINYECEH